DRLRAGEGGDNAALGLAQQPLRLVERALPRDLLEAATSDPQQRVAQPVLGTQVLIREAALVAEPAAVDVGVVPREDPLDLPFARRRVDVAADRAQPADRRRVLDLPRPGLEAVHRRREGAHGAELDDVAAERRAVRVVFERGDLRLRTAVHRDELAVLGNLFAEARAAVAQDAALTVERDQR